MVNKDEYISEYAKDTYLVTPLLRDTSFLLVGWKRSCLSNYRFQTPV